MLIGYARVSTSDQELDLQLDALAKAGCEKVFTDKVSGAAKHRPGLNDALGFVREGDTVVVWKLDRLGRSMRQLVDLVAKFEERKVEFTSITDGIDTSTPAGRFFFHIMAALAEMERELIRERTKAGLEVARSLGRVGGRPRKLTKKKLQMAQALIASGMPKKDVAEQIGVSRSTLYERLRDSAESAGT